MPILMEEPLKYLMDPNVQRFGAILKNVNTGQIVGHVKETGEMGRLLANLPGLAGLNPATVAVDLIDRGVKSYQIGKLQQSVEEIHRTLDALQMTTNVAALASVANLGISVAGFALISHKLSLVDSKLDRVVDGLESVKRVLRAQDVKWEAMSDAMLQRAAEALIVAEGADSKERRLELLNTAVKDFSLLRKYYARLLGDNGVFDTVELSVENLRELVARYTFCCMGLLHAEFLMGDLGSYRKYLESITQEYRDLVGFNPRDLYLMRSDKLSVLALDYDYKEQSELLTALGNYVHESTDRVDSFAYELEYLEENKLSADEYISSLRDEPTGLVLLRKS